MTTNHMAIRRYSFIGHFRICYYCITNIYLNLSIYFNALLGRLDIQTDAKTVDGLKCLRGNIFFWMRSHNTTCLYMEITFFIRLIQIQIKAFRFSKKNPFCTLFRHKICKQMRHNAKHEHLAKLQNLTKVLIDRAIQTIPNH